MPPSPSARCVSRVWFPTASCGSRTGTNWGTWTASATPPHPAGRQRGLEPLQHGRPGVLAAHVLASVGAQRLPEHVVPLQPVDHLLELRVVGEPEPPVGPP